jgi:hypothetical protein
MTGSRRWWVVPAVIAAIAIGCLIAGTVTWQMKSGGVHCPSTVACPGIKPHRHHPLRAELLWAFGVLLGIIAAEVAVWQRRQASFRRSIAGSHRYGPR